MELMDKKYSAFKMKVCLFLSVSPLFPGSKQTAQWTEEANANNGIKIRAGCTESRGKQRRDWPRGLTHPVSPPQPGQVLALVKTSFLSKEISFLSHRTLDFLMSFLITGNRMWQKAMKSSQVSERSRTGLEGQGDISHFPTAPNEHFPINDLTVFKETTALVTQKWSQALHSGSRAGTNLYLSPALME